jgi:hypothetical protein
MSSGRVMPRLFEAVPCLAVRWSRPASALAAGWLVLAALIGACSSVETHTLDGTGGTGGQIAGGTGGSPCAGLSGQCVPSCAQEVSDLRGEICDVNTGQWRCAEGSVLRSGCAPGSCARWDNGYCCDVTTGVSRPPSCQPDGFTGQCAAGTRAASGGDCIPDGLATTNCRDLSGTSCAMAGQLCQFVLTFCSCDPGDGGLTWACQTLAL